MSIGVVLLIVLAVVVVFTFGLVLGGAFITVGLRRSENTNAITTELLSILNILNLNTKELSIGEGDRIEDHTHKALSLLKNSVDTPTRKTKDSK